jgi:hypothetical protein
MHEGETIKQPQERIKQLELENELLKAKICELEARLAQYENAHTPPSLRRGRNRKKNQDTKDKGKPGQKVGHKGVTRPLAIPDSQGNSLERSTTALTTGLRSFLIQVWIQPIIGQRELCGHMLC